MSTRHDDEYAMRQWAVAVFGAAHPGRRPAEQPPVLPNQVAREGSNSGDARPGRNAMRDWVGDLFGTDENARGLHRDWA